MTTEPGIDIENLAAFRRALKASGSGAEKALRVGLKDAGTGVTKRAAQYAPHKTGMLEAGYMVRTSGVNAFVANRVPYAAGAEWGVHGKWSGFLKYPGAAPNGRGRFAWRAVYEGRDEIQDTITKRLESIIELQGWARP